MKVNGNVLVRTAFGMAATYLSASLLILALNDPTLELIVAAVGVGLIGAGFARLSWTTRVVEKRYPSAVQTRLREGFQRGRGNTNT